LSSDLRAFDLNSVRAVLIRAPAVTLALPGVTVLATVLAQPSSAATVGILESLQAEKGGWCATRVGDDWEVAVAVKQRNILGTAFHPEFTPNDLRWHQYFIDLVLRAKIAASNCNDEQPI